MVFPITSHRMPNLFFYLQGTHVYHLNYGIFLLAAGGATPYPRGRVDTAAGSGHHLVRSHR